MSDKEIKMENGSTIKLMGKDGPVIGSKEHPGFKAWHCTDCNSRGVGEFEQLQEHWATCEKYQELKTHKEQTARAHPTQ